MDPVELPSNPTAANGSWTLYARRGHGTLRAGECRRGDKGVWSSAAAASADWRSRGGEAMQVAARSSPWG